MFNNTWFVVLAAGESKRFKERGHTDSKATLPLQMPDGRRTTMLVECLKSLKYVADNKPIIASRDLLHVTSASIHHIDDTGGQADTAYQVVKELPSEDRVVILDVDAIIDPHDVYFVSRLVETFDVVMAVAETFDPNCSRVDQVPTPTRIVEKEPISQWGIIGVRGFRNCGLLTDCLASVRETCMIEGREPYLSEAMAIYPGTRYAHVIRNYTDLGTPQRIEEAGWKIVGY